MDTVRACIERHALDTPERSFMIAPETGQTLSFGELKSAVDDIGRHLDQLGLGQGAKVAFLLNNGYWTLRLFLGVMANNRIIVPLNAVAGTLQLVHVPRSLGYRGGVRRTRISRKARRNHGAGRSLDSRDRND